MSICGPGRSDSGIYTKATRPAYLKISDNSPRGIHMTDPIEPGNGAGSEQLFSRRKILRVAGIGGASLVAFPLLASACGSDDESSPSGGSGEPAASGSDTTVGGGEAPASAVQGILNYIDPIEAEFSGAGTDYEIGLVLAFTGPGAFFGRTMSAGANLAAEHIKQLGGPNIKFVEKDHKSGDPQAGVTAVQELGLAGVPAKLASYVDDLGAMSPGTEQFKMFTFDGGGGTSTFGQGLPYFWGTRAITPNDGWPGTIQYINEEFGDVKKVSSVAWDLGPLNQINIDDLQRRLTDGGIEMGVYELAAIGATDYSSQIQKIKADKPSVVFLSIFGDDIGVFMKQWVTAGIDVPVVAAEYTQSSADIAGGAYEGMYLSFDYFNAEDPDNGWSKIFIDEFAAANDGTLPDYYAANYYEDTFGMWNVMQRVLKAGGDIMDGEQLDIAWRENAELPSVYGGDDTTAGRKSLSMETHSVTARPLTMSVFQDGKVVPLAYFDLEARDYRLA
jgi:branched-chain amino acid transport system substrate-binding protein